MTVLPAATERILNTLLDDILATLDGIPDDDLATWLPTAASAGGGEMNTFAAIAVHTVSAGAWMLAHQVLGEEHARDREAEFRATATRAEIDALYAGFREELRTQLTKLDDVDLAAPPATLRPGREDWTRADYLLHVVDHTGLHLGHLQIQRQLWLAEQGE